MKKFLIPLAIVGVALIVAAIVLVRRGSEEVTETVTAPPSGPAAENQFLALERLLGRLGVEARSTPLLSDLPRPAPDVVFLFSPGRRDWNERDQRLLGWVDQGGHLILGALEPDDAFLSWLGLERDGWRITPVQGKWDYVDPPDWEQDGRAVYATSFPRNEGRITVVTGFEHLGGRGLGEEGLARLVWTATCLEGKPQRALLVYGDEFPGLATLLWSRAPLLVISGALLLVALLWGASRRFGPILPDPEPARRSLIEHVQASGRLLWRHHRVGPLLSGAREELRDQIRIRHPELVQLSSAELALRLGPLVRITPAELQAALEARAPLQADEFTRVVRTLARARRELS